MFLIEQIDIQGFDGNFSYLATTGDGAALLVDPCGNPEILRKAVAAYPDCKPCWILLTHGHHDHISALDEVKSFFPGKVCAGIGSKVPVDLCLKDSEILPFGNGFVQCIATPGHTEDSVCWLLSDQSAVFTGDTLFIDYIGFCKAKTMYHSLEKLKQIPDSAIIYPGHNYGHVPSDTIGHQKACNPYFRPDSFAEFELSLLNLD